MTDQSCLYTGVDKIIMRKCSRLALVVHVCEVAKVQEDIGFGWCHWLLVAVVEMVPLIADMW